MYVSAARKSGVPLPPGMRTGTNSASATPRSAGDGAPGSGGAAAAAASGGAEAGTYTPAMLLESKRKEFHRRSAAWVPLEWAPRLLYWFVKQTLPLVHSVPKREGRPVTDVVLEARRSANGAVARACALVCDTLLTKRWPEVEEEVLAISATPSHARPALRAPAAAEAEATSLGQFAEAEVDLELQELLPIERAWVPAPADVCEYVVREVIEDALVLAIDAPEIYAVVSTVRDMVDLLECVDDLVEDVVEQVGREQALERAQADREAFRRQLDDLFDSKTVPMLQDTEDDSDAHDADLVIGGRTNVEQRVCELLADFNDSVSTIEQLLATIDSLTDIARAVDSVRELETVVAKRSGRLPASAKSNGKAKAKAKREPAAVEPASAPVVVSVSLSSVRANACGGRSVVRG